mmetsp:Transcript_9402/g.25595  ORF Transcript_9402/g.25595 Transcript_9402/m.25595 type:complete len:322 (+) Transcript_9402:50-1015(+)
MRKSALLAAAGAGALVAGADGLRFGSSLTPGATRSRVARVRPVRAATMPGAHDRSPVARTEGGRVPISDNVFNLLMIAAFRVVMGRVAGFQAPQPFFDGGTGESFQGLVEVSKQLLADSPDATTERVLGVLRGFPTQPQLLQNHRFWFELMAMFSPMLFTFLVGSATTERWEHPSGQTWGSRVVIEKCRFLEAAECKGLCISLCKQPTERFFNDELGLPVSMVPDFSDGSCTMTWGEAPRADALDDQDLSCYDHCSVKGKAVGSVAVKSHLQHPVGPAAAAPPLVGPLCPTTGIDDSSAAAGMRMAGFPEPEGPGLLHDSS